MTNSRTAATHDKDRSPRAHQAHRTGPEAAAPARAAAAPGLQRAVPNPGTAKPAEILALQKSYGNRAVTRMLAPTIQPKLMVGPADDAYEREADRIADRVVSSPAPEVARQTNTPTIDESLRG